MHTPEWRKIINNYVESDCICLCIHVDIYRYTLLFYDMLTFVPDKYIPVWQRISVTNRHISECTYSTHEIIHNILMFRYVYINLFLYWDEKTVKAKLLFLKTL